MEDSVLKTKARVFAKESVFLCRTLKENHVESVLINQFLRCATSVGANIHEAEYAQGPKDFISKFEIALKECNESDFWLYLLYETGSLPKSDYDQFIAMCIELRRMLVASVKTMKNKKNDC